MQWKNFSGGCLNTVRWLYKVSKRLIKQWSVFEGLKWALPVIAFSLETKKIVKCWYSLHSEDVCECVKMPMSEKREKSLPPFDFSSKHQLKCAQRRWRIQEQRNADLYWMCRLHSHKWEYRGVAQWIPLYCIALGNLVLIYMVY